MTATDTFQALLEVNSQILAELQRSNADGHLWDADDIAYYAKVSPDTVRNKFICKKDFPPPRIIPSGGKRWKPCEVRAYIDKRRG